MRHFMRPQRNLQRNPVLDVMKQVAMNEISRRNTQQVEQQKLAREQQMNQAAVGRQFNMMEAVRGQGFPGSEAISEAGNLKEAMALRDILLGGEKRKIDEFARQTSARDRATKIAVTSGDLAPWMAFSKEYGEPIPEPVKKGADVAMSAMKTKFLKEGDTQALLAMSLAPASPDTLKAVGLPEINPDTGKPYSIGEVEPFLDLGIKKAKLAAPARKLKAKVKIKEENVWDTTYKDALSIGAPIEKAMAKADKAVQIFRGRKAKPVSPPSQKPSLEDFYR